MIARVHRRIGSISVPQFPNRGCPAVHHVSPTWVFGARSDLEGKVGAPIPGECLHEPLHANQAGAHGAIRVVFYVADQSSGNGLSFFFRREPKGKRKSAGRLRAVTVLMALRPEQRAIESRPDL